MKPERWQQIERIYYEVLKLEPAQREAFLVQSCAGDEALRNEVDNLLKGREEAGDFIKSPAVEVAARALFGADAGAPSQIPKPRPAKEDEKAVPGSGMDAERGKPVKQAPWWMYVIAAAFLICAVVRYYACYNHPDFNLGWTMQSTKSESGLLEVLITAVEPDSAAAKAGAQPGDVLLASNSDGLFQTPDQSKSGWYYWKTGRTYRIEIRRKEESKFIYLTLARKPLRDWWMIPGHRPALASLIISVIEFALAFLIAFRRPYDLTARWGALFIAMLGLLIIYGFNLGYGWHSTILGLPRVIGWLIVLLPKICEAVFASVGLTFTILFPRNFHDRRWIWVLAWLPAAMLLPLAVFSSHPPIHAFPRWWPNWYLTLGTALALACWLAMAAFLILNYRKLHDLNEQRRMRVIVAGAVITLLAYIPVTTAGHLPQWTYVSRLNTPPYSLLLILCCLGCVLPISMAYAILKHRVFDIRVMIRQGVWYGTARGALLSLVPIVAIIMAGDLVLHRSQPLGEILGQRGFLYAALAGGALMLHLCRKKWLMALDRRFFREQYNAQRVLHAVIEDIRTARSFEKSAPGVVLQIEAALHPQFAAILVRQPVDSSFRLLAGGNRALTPIAAGSRLMALIRMPDKPVEVSPEPTGWPRSHLPQEESDFLRRARIEWIFPISLTEGRKEALLAVGPKRSEMPYSQEDRELLQGIASSLALLLEQSPIVDTDSGGFKECPECGTCYDSDSDSCQKEGTALTPLPYPRLLAHRYRFEQRLGKGGMGVVYRSFDTELDRHVAIKLIHPHLTSSTEAAARFKQEARAAGGFAHPNVVTIYDYGVSGDGRAYLVMELLHGSTLRQELMGSHRLSPSRVCAVLSDVCAAVDAAHHRMLLHRDLKPENIFLASSERTETAKILDFGVVKSLTRSDEDPDANQTEPGRLIGTLKYMSPEELRGEPPSESWDLWALAVVAYEMLAGAHPFAGSTSLEIRYAILDNRLAPLQKHLPEAPAAWQQFFDNALAFNPASRPQSAFQLLHGFEQTIK
ncbi:MAG: protein kinase [Acidobacteria bacterium]|nr:protein kinase [Acidobacteriota bacterium]